MIQHDLSVRRSPQWSLRAFFFCIAGLVAFALPVHADDAVPIALHLTPGRYVRTQKLVHLVVFDIPKTYKSMAAGRADDETILEDRVQVITLKERGAIDIAETNTRHFGGDHPKESGNKVRTFMYDGTIAANGTLTPPQTVLEDAGDGALDQLPDIPLAPGQQWTFSRHIKVERDFADGPMTYLDKIDRIEDRNGHKIAIITVTGTGPMTPNKEMLDHGFRAATMDLTGTAEFDTTAGLPGIQHYTAKVTWATKAMFLRVPVVLTDTYDATPVEPKPQS
jgi:hypothetical protein